MTAEDSTYAQPAIEATPPIMTDAVRVGVGIALMAAGMAAVGYAVYLEMIRAVPLRW